MANPLYLQTVEHEHNVLVEQLDASWLSESVNSIYNWW
jgi:hypothetical protein